MTFNFQTYLNVGMVYMNIVTCFNNLLYEELMKTEYIVHTPTVWQENGIAPPIAHFPVSRQCRLFGLTNYGVRNPVVLYVLKLTWANFINLAFHRPCNC